MWLFFWGILWAKPVENPIALAAQLARDGEMARAESVLAGVSADAFVQNGSLFFITKGLIALHKKEIAEALDAFVHAEQSLKASKEKVEQDELENISLYIAQCHVLLQQPDQALAILEHLNKDVLAVYLLKLEAYAQKEDWVQAYSVQKEGIAKYPLSQELHIQEVLIASKLGLMLPVRDLIPFFAHSETIDAKTFLQLAGTLRDDGHRKEAGLYLDVGRKRFFSEDIWKASAIVALEQGEWLQGAEILSVLSVEIPSYALETAQAYAQAGDISKALLYNSFAPISSEKLTQRLSLLLQNGSYDLIAPLQKELARYSAKIEDSVRYGLAYAHFQRGLYQEAQDSLAGISDPKIFRQSVALQKAIYKCMDGGCL